MKPPWRRLVLTALALWACWLSLETLLRPAGYAPAGALPPRLRVDGAALPRRPAPPLRQAQPAVQLPDGVVELASARYGSRTVRLLGHRRSGGSGRMEVEAINTALSGSATGGRCLVVDGQGRVRAQLATLEAWQAWRRAHPPSRGQTIAWLAGLRPRQANTCLWMNVDPAPWGQESQ